MQIIEANAMWVSNSDKQIIDYYSLVWEMETEPQFAPNSLPQLLHLYTITGLIMIGYWPKDGLLGEHFTAWAPLEVFTYTLH